MKNERTPRVMEDTVFHTSCPHEIPTRRERVIKDIIGIAVIVALVLFTSWAIVTEF